MGSSVIKVIAFLLFVLCGSLCFVTRANAEEKIMASIKP